MVLNLNLYTLHLSRNGEFHFKIVSELHILQRLTLAVRIPFRQGVLDTTLCDKVGQWVAAGRWFSPVSFSNKTDRHDIGEILLKVALNTIKLNLAIFHNANYHKLNVLTCEKTHSHSLGSCLLFGCCEIILRKQHIVHNW